MTYDELREIYEKHMMNDFPDDERKPLKMIMSRYKKKQNFCLLYLEGNEIKAYSIMEFANQSLLMDYFAVFPQFRNQGMGTRFLQEMRQYFIEYEALFIESEAAYDEVSLKRLDFYRNAGALLSGIQVHLYHVDYEIMVLPLKREIRMNEVEIMLNEIYTKIYPKAFRMMFLKWKLRECDQVVKKSV